MFPSTVCPDDATGTFITLPLVVLNCPVFFFDTSCFFASSVQYVAIFSPSSETDNPSLPTISHWAICSFPTISVAGVPVEGLKLHVTVTSRYELASSSAFFT